MGWYYRIKDLFATTWWDDLVKFLNDPGGFIWAYILEKAEAKLEEILDAHW